MGNILNLEQEIHDIFVAISHVQPLHVVDYVLAHEALGKSIMLTDSNLPVNVIYDMQVLELIYIKFSQTMNL